MLFDLLALGDEIYLSRPFAERRAALHTEFACIDGHVSFAAVSEIWLGSPPSLPAGKSTPSSLQPSSPSPLAASGGTAVATAAPIIDSSLECDAKDGEGMGATIASVAGYSAASGTAGAGGADSVGGGDGLGGGDEEAMLAIETALHRSIKEGCEGLMLKRLDFGYQPSWGTRRSEGWVKCKKDYIDGLGDSLDLVPIGGWRGQGRKRRWVSPWLMATYDARSGTLGSVCRVMSGFSDTFYKEHTIKYLGAEIGVEIGGEEGEGGGGGGEEEEEEEEEQVDEEGEEGELAGEGDTQDGRPPLLLDCPAEGVETGEHCQYWFRPTEVWEVRGADITISPVHMSAAGLVHEQRGLSMRFPRFIRKRPDKRVLDATTPELLAALYRKQTQGQAGA